MIIWKHYPDDCKRLGYRDDLGRLGRTDFYPNDLDDRERSEAIIWKPFRTTKTTEAIQIYPRKYQFVPEFISLSAFHNGIRVEKSLSFCFAKTLFINSVKSRVLNCLHLKRFFSNQMV